MEIDELNKREITIKIDYNKMSDYHLALEKVFECIENGGKSEFDFKDSSWSESDNEGITRYIIDFDSKQTCIMR